MIGWKITAFLINLAIVIYVVYVMQKHYAANFSVKSYSFLFNTLSLVWLLLRGTFWFLIMVSNVSMSPFLYYMLFWVPANVEFTSFMLLPLFFIQVIYARYLFYVLGSKSKC